MSHGIGVWIAIWLPIVIGVATAIVLAFMSDGKGRASRDAGAEPRRGDAAFRRRRPGGGGPRPL